MRVNMNMPALIAAANVARAGERTGVSMRRLSSGFRINSTLDDPAGMSISRRMTNQVTGTQQASSNSLNGISIVQTAEGGLQEIHNIIQRMRQLTIQAQNDTNVDDNRELIHKELRQLSNAITEMANGTQFNGINLLDQHSFGVRPADMSTATHIMNPGSAARSHIYVEAGNGTHSWVAGAFVEDPNGTHILNDGSQFILADPLQNDIATHRLEEPRVLIQIGPDMDQNLQMNLVDARNHNLGTIGANGRVSFSIADVVNLTNEDDIAFFNLDGEDGREFRDRTIDALDSALLQISQMRGTFGAYQNRLEHTVANLNVMDENLQNARMRIRDADMAFEMTELSISRVIEQSGMAILAQANMRPQQVLQLLQ